MRLIWAYNDIKPSEKIIKHGTNNKGTKSVSLINLAKTINQEERLKDTFTYDIRNSNFSLPHDRDTFYRCEIFKIPPMIEKHHVISAKAILDEKHSQILHHILVYSCHHAVDDSHVGISYECYNNETNMADHLNGCDTVIFAWAVGGEQEFFPEDVGFPLGGSDKPLYVRMETHYDNPFGVKNVIDQSGVKLWLTKKLKKYDQAVLEVGHTVGPYQIIPPKTEEFITLGHCSEECLNEAFKENKLEEVKIFSVMLHAHLKGVKMRLRHYRGDEEIEPITYDDSYDFNYQDYKLMKPMKVLKKGDRLTLECYYNTKTDSETIQGGLSTRDEMCLAYIRYYPKISLAHCQSNPNMEKISTAYKSIKEKGWTKELKVEYQEFVKKPEFVAVCTGNAKTFPINEKTIKLPKVKKNYLPPDFCKLITPSSSSTIHPSVTLFVTLFSYYSYVIY
ncbi:DgyrCDS1656 [Dimorphilus gyrociliatus]|nr:DgyrCDS1656 [Dimorphilus gyrociliatus]